MKKIGITFLMLLSVFVFVACSSDNDLGKGVKNTKAPELIGTWDCFEEDIFLFNFTFHEDGTFQSASNDKIMLEGIYEIKEENVEINGIKPDTGEKETIVARYEVIEDNLTLQEGSMLFEFVKNST